MLLYLKVKFDSLAWEQKEQPKPSTKLMIVATVWCLVEDRDRKGHSIWSEEKS